MLCGFLPALNIVSEKEVGTIEQINVTPVPKFTFILAKLLPYWIIGFLVLTICFGLGLAALRHFACWSFWGYLRFRHSLCTCHIGDGACYLQLLNDYAASHVRNVVLYVDSHSR